MALKGESQFCPDRKDWNEGCKFWPDLNGLNRQMLVLACLEWLGISEVDFGSTGIEEVGFGMTGTAWKERSRFWSFRNNLECRNSFTDRLQWHKLILA
jgi:hypothetical protein